MNFSHWATRWIYLMCIYIYQGYVVAAIINMLMYFQIMQYESDQIELRDAYLAKKRKKDSRRKQRKMFV